MRDADHTDPATLRDDTPGRLVAAAEELFAQGGEEATSLRAITRAARSNAAAVHYHFGGRDELLRAVVEHHLLPLNARRFALLDQAIAQYGEAVPVAVVVAAMVRPDLDLLATLRPDRVRVARLLGRAAVSSGSAVAASMRGQFDALAARVAPVLRVSLPEVPPDELHQRLRLVWATVAATLAATDESPGPDEAARLLAFCAAGLGAPATIPTPPEKAKKRKKRPGP